MGLHRMHSERYTVLGATLEAIAHTRATGVRIIALCNTTVRTLETGARRALPEPAGCGTWPTLRGETDILINPGHRFAWIELLITDFHLQSSTHSRSLRACGAGALPILQATVTP